MQVFEYKRGEQLSLSDSVLALGFFDGVHAAHRLLIEDGMRIAKERGVPFAIMTFSSEGALKKSTPRIYGTAERIELLGAMGIENVVIIDFASVSNMTPDEFVKEALIKDIGCKVAVAGYNFRFGKGAVGDSAVLLTHMGTAVVNGEGDAGECFLDIFRSNPVRRVLGVVIVAVYGQTVRPQEVLAVTVVVLILGAHIVPADSGSQIRSVHYFRLARIGAVAGGVDVICTVKGEHGLYLLTIFCKVAQSVVLPSGSFDFSLHPC